MIVKILNIFCRKIYLSDYLNEGDLTILMMYYINTIINLFNRIFHVLGMSCASRTHYVEQAALKQNGVVEANVNLATKTIAISYFPNDVNPNQLALLLR